MDDLEGWQQTRWGMTADEIISSVGADNLRRLSEPHTYPDHYADMTVPIVRIGKYEFDVLFQMGNQSHRLEQVVLRCADETVSLAAFNEAMKLLRERFGPPQRVGTSDTFEWRFPTTTIEACHILIEDVLSQATIRFFPSEEPTERGISAF